MILQFRFGIAHKVLPLTEVDEIVAVRNLTKHALLRRAQKAWQRTRRTSAIPTLRANDLREMGASRFLEQRASGCKA